MSKSKKSDVEDSEDHEIFDINDFTTASDWERFVVQVEELIAEWKLNSNISDNFGIDQKSLEDVNFENGEWHEKAETIQFADEISFTITYYSLSSKTPLNDEKIKKSENLINQTQSYHELGSNDFESVSISNVHLENIKRDESSTPNLVNLPPKSMADLLNKANDFQTVSFNQSTTPSIAYWYGLCKFVVISPTRSNSFIETESRANVILSSISIAINNTGCSIPVFVQVHSHNREMFLGLCEGSALKTHFQIVHFNYTPPQYAYLPGLLEVFKSKLGNHLTNSSLLISVSVRFTYLIQESTFLDWSSSKTSYENKSFQEVELIDDKIEDIYPDVKHLPFGTVQDCIDSIYLSCVWSNLSEDIVVDSESFSDLNPQHSNDWSLTLNNICDKCDFQLSNFLNKYLEELKRTISVNQLVGSATSSVVNSDQESLAEEIKYKLTSSSSARRLDKMYNLSSNLVGKATNRMRILNINENSLPLDKGFLDFIMGFLFPDANLIKSTNFAKPETNSTESTNNFKKFLKRLNLMKSSSTDNSGLLNRLVICLGLVNQIGQTKAIAQLWKEFLLELRYRYESSIQIPELSQPDLNKFSNQEQSFIPPDLSRCLLHQKIQMLNCCIKKKIERLNFESTVVKEVKFEKKDDSAEEDDDDQFFDCEDEAALIEQESNKNATKVPEGRLKKFGDLTLIKNPNESLYVPYTQESTPMTEDMLEQHASVLVNLGCGDDAALLRAKIQSASLLSDMESFKAANPECLLEDFVRWYSPRDWVCVEETIIDPETQEEKITKKYELSNRMKIAGNMWVEVWNNAKSVPMRRQKRLFDDTKEAENVFNWLNSLTIGQIIEQTLPILFYSSIYTCYEEASNLDLNSFVDPIFDVLVDKAIKISRNNEFKKYQDLTSYVKSIEQIVSLMKSLKLKFLSKKSSLSNKKEEEEAKEFLKSLLKSSLGHDSCEVKIDNGAHCAIGKLISKLCTKKKPASRTKNSRTSEYKSLKSEDAEDTQNAEDEDIEDEHPNFNNILLPFDKPFKREYILRSSVPRPAPYSRQSPQRMYCLINNLEFRLAGAFTEDTMFF